MTSLRACSSSLDSCTHARSRPRKASASPQWVVRSEFISTLTPHFGPAHGAPSDSSRALDPDGVNESDAVHQRARFVLHVDRLAERDLAALCIGADDGSGFEESRPGNRRKTGQKTPNRVEQYVHSVTQMEVIRLHRIAPPEAGARMVSQPPGPDSKSPSDERSVSFPSLPGNKTNLCKLGRADLCQIADNRFC